MKTALRILEKLRTDAVEILPGPMAKGAYHAVRNSEPKRTLLAGDSFVPGLSWMTSFQSASTG
ncbi:hypothetical protein [Cutibacterium sp. V947]|uniref:hypothetical protein n=1 Tax=unclassified Cutibacterium TaxID=2649671 RepID=UPI003EE0ED63